MRIGTKIDRQLQQKGIKWVFQPPAAPHASGVWERLLQITKKHLKSAVADMLLSDIELTTLLAEVDSIVNNLPITALSNDPEDCSALTPNHFLLQKATQLPPRVFVKGIRFLESDGERCSSLRITTGRGGYENICRLFRKDQSGSSQGEMCRLATWYL